MLAALVLGGTANVINMTLNLVSLSRSRCLALLVPFALAATVGCFTGGNVGLTGGETGGSESDTGDSCEVGTEDCACTGGNGCNAGLMCEGGTCVPLQTDCGDGIVQGDEECDDGNAINSDSCTTLCRPPSCDDGLVSGAEIATDCGLAACGVPCAFGEPCMIANDCEFPVCGPDGDGGMICQRPTSCSQYLMFTPNAMDGNQTIDPDGAGGVVPEFDVYCDMSKDGGGWTLVFVASDDGTNTWTWNNRAKMANEPDEIGSLTEINKDFMSPAYHILPARDLLFIHQPSTVWAHYGTVGDGTMTLGEIISAAGSPVCDYALGGNGHELTGGTLSAVGLLCDTDLYFNLGDHEIDLASCMDFGSGSNTASFGPVWSADKGAGCPFDDPAEFGLGPHGPCGACPNNFASTEFNYLGYGNALMLNEGAGGMAQNYMQLYVR